MPEESTPNLNALNATFATQEEINAVTNGKPVTAAFVEAYYDITETGDITHGALAFAVAVDTMIGLNVETDAETIVSDLQWIAEMANAAANEIAEKFLN